MNTSKTQRSLKSAISKSLALCLLAAPFQVHAQTSTWDGGGGNNLWENAANWNPDGVPGTSGNTTTNASIGGAALGVYNVSLTSDITLGAFNGANGQIQVNGGTAGGSILTIGTGAVIGNLQTMSVDGVNYGNSSIIFNDGNWSQDATSGGLISIGRLGSANSNKTSLFQINGGTVSNLRTQSQGRIEIGHTANFGTAIFEVTGGALTNSSGVTFQGDTTGNAHFLISGGSVSVTAVDMDNDGSDGLKSLIRVTGDDATINFGGITTLAKNTANTTGSSTAEFVFNSTGISQITATTLNLGIGAAKGLLDVDVSLLDSDGTVAFTLFGYTTLQNGTFGSVSVNYGATSLTAGTLGSLGLNEYALDYGTGSSDSIQLYYNVVPEPSTWALLLGSLAVTVLYRLRRRRA